jgi:hypothetical protein
MARVGHVVPKKDEICRAAERALSLAGGPIGLPCELQLPGGARLPVLVWLFDRSPESGAAAELGLRVVGLPRSPA